MDSTGDEILRYSFKHLKQIFEVALGKEAFNNYLKSRNFTWCYWHKSAICNHDILIPFNSAQQAEI